MKYIFALFFLIVINSCTLAPDFTRDKAAFDASKVQQRFKSVADMNDAYFEIKENNFFEYYRQLFDSLKNTSYPGKYSLKDDTLLLHFYDKTGETKLGSKALVDEEKNEVQFFK